LLALATFAMAQAPAADAPHDRFVPLKYSDLTQKQKDAVELYQAHAQKLLGGAGPYDIDSRLMARARASSLYIGVRSPELSDAVIKAAISLEHGAVPRKLNEFAVLMTARYWTSQYLWWAHHKLATQFNLSEAIVQAVAAGKRPAKMQPDEAAVYNFCTELRAKHDVSDAAFAAAKQYAGGEQGVVELMGIVSSYDLISMWLNVDRFPLPEGETPELKPLR
jgi:4-carboxymuconolactone decarboxylase